MSENKRKSSSNAPMPRKTRRTRSQTQHFLVGPSQEAIAGSKLPTLRQVMQYVLHLRESSARNVTVKLHIQNAVDEVMALWLLAGIKTITKVNAIKRFETVWKKWLLLKKTAGQRYEARNQRAFELELSKLWDIGAPDAISTIEANTLLSDNKKHEDISFYHDQRGPRLRMIAGINTQQEETLNMTAREPASSSKCQLTERSSIWSQAADTPLAHSSSHHSSKVVTLIAPANLINNNELRLVFNRFKVIDNAATMIIAAMIRACNGNPDDFDLST